MCLTCPHNTLRTLRLSGQVLNLPDPRDSIPVSSTTVWGLNKVTQQQELRPKGPPAMLPVSTILKEVLDKFEQDL